MPSRFRIASACLRMLASRVSLRLSLVSASDSVCQPHPSSQYLPSCPSVALLPPSGAPLAPLVHGRTRIRTRAGKRTTWRSFSARSCCAISILSVPNCISSTSDCSLPAAVAAVLPRFIDLGSARRVEGPRPAQPRHRHSHCAASTHSRVGEESGLKRLRDTSKYSRPLCHPSPAIRLLTSRSPRGFHRCLTACDGLCGRG